MNLGGFSQIFSDNNLGFKPNGFKRYLKPTAQIEEIEKKLASGLSVDDLSEEEYKALNAFEKAESASFHAEVNSEMAKAERIAIKLAKGEKLTAEEERFISEKYPDLRREAEEARKQGEEVKKRIEGAKTKEEKQQIAQAAISNVGAMVSKGSLAPIQANIKLAAIEKAVEEADDNNTNSLLKLSYKNSNDGAYFINKKV